MFFSTTDCWLFYIEHGRWEAKTQALINRVKGYAHVRARARAHTHTHTRTRTRIQKPEYVRTSGAFSPCREKIAVEVYTSSAQAVQGVASQMQIQEGKCIKYKYFCIYCKLQLESEVLKGPRIKFEFKYSTRPTSEASSVI